MLSGLLIVAGCRDEDADDAAQPDDQQVNEDVEHARNLWTQIEDYPKWPAPEGFEGWQEGKSPHGSVLRYYVNAEAQEGLMTDGAVIVKENYSEQSDDALMSVTVMEQRKGYDPETGNWFYVKYSPDGEVMGDKKKLAGLVGKGGSKGCIPCHATADGDDYLFIND
jgi:hypothetical protein